MSTNYNRYMADIRKAGREEAADAADRARREKENNKSADEKAIDLYFRKIASAKSAREVDEISGEDIGVPFDVFINYIIAEKANEHWFSFYSQAVRKVESFGIPFSLGTISDPALSFPVRN